MAPLFALIVLFVLSHSPSVKLREWNGGHRIVLRAEFGLEFQIPEMLFDVVLQHGYVSPRVPGPLFDDRHALEMLFGLDRAHPPNRASAQDDYQFDGQNNLRVCRRESLQRRQ